VGRRSGFKSMGVLGLFWPQFVLVFFEEPGNTVGQRLWKKTLARKLNREDVMDEAGKGLLMTTMGVNG